MLRPVLFDGFPWMGVLTWCNALMMWGPATTCSNEQAARLGKQAIRILSVAHICRLGVDSHTCEGLHQSRGSADVHETNSQNKTPIHETTMTKAVAGDWILKRRVAGTMTSPKPMSTCVFTRAFPQNRTAPPN